MYDEIISVAKRDNNKKRKFLLVNKIQGKHIPVNPQKCLELFDSIYYKIENKFNGENIILIGFSETATAIGSRLAVKLNCKYIQTTREYKDTLKEKRTYVKHGDEYTLTTYDKKGKLQSRITYKRMSKGDAEERWDDYKDAIKDYKKDLKTYSDQYDDFKDYYDYGYGYNYGYGNSDDYGYGNSDDYGSGSKSGSDDSKSSKKGVDKI